MVGCSASERRSRPVEEWRSWRTVFIESVARYREIFEQTPQFTERVPMVKGRLDAKASTATGYAWIAWEKRVTEAPRLMWVPPCRKKLERPSDYQS